MTGPGRVVIVVEDDDSMRQAMARILRVAGYVPVVFPSAEAMLASGRTGEAICLVVDVQLPAMTGFALYERLAAAGNAPPVVFITGFDEPETHARADEGPGRALLVKPFSGHALLEIVERMAP